MAGSNIYYKSHHCIILKPRETHHKLCTLCHSAGKASGKTARQAVCT